MDAAPLPVFVRCRAAAWRRGPGCVRQSSLILAAVTTLAQPLLRRKLRQRGQVEPGYLDAVEERFGRYGAEAGGGMQGRQLWYHDRRSLKGVHRRA